MEFKIKCYFDPTDGRDYSKMVFLGANTLADEFTLNHYFQLVEQKVPFTIGFQTVDFPSGEIKYHQFTAVPGSFSCGVEEKKEVKVLSLSITDEAHHSFITQEQYDRNMKEMHATLDNLSRMA